jgi:hypothetical protein
LESIGKEVEKQTSSRAASEKDTFLKRESMWHGCEETIGTEQGETEKGIWV